MSLLSAEQRVLEAIINTSTRAARSYGEPSTTDHGYWPLFYEATYLLRQDTVSHTRPVDAVIAQAQDYLRPTK